MAEPTNTNFPTSADTSTTLGGDQINIYSTTLNGSIDNITLTIPTPSTISGVNFPCYIRIDNELIWVTGASGVNFTGDTRGAGGTTATAHTSGVAIYEVYAANLFNQIKRAVLAIENNVLQRGTTTIDFGSIPSYGKSFIVTVAGMTTANIVSAVQSGAAASGKSSDENEMDALDCSCISGTGQFTVYAIPRPGPVVGKFVINYNYF